MIPWATAKSLFDLGLTDLALFVLNSGVQQAAYLSTEAVVGMSNAYNDIGIMLLYNRQKKEAATKIFTLTTQIHPSFLAYFNLAVIALDDKDYQQATAYLEQSLQLEDNQATAHAALGKIMAKFLPDPDKARYHIKKAIELDPNLEADLAAWKKMIPDG